MSDSSSYELIWKEAINQIRAELPEQEFLAWFNLDFQEAGENSFIVSAPSVFYCDQVEKRYRAYIEGKIEGLTGKKITLNLIVKPKNPETVPDNASGGTENPEKPVPIAGTAEKKALPGKESPRSPDTAGISGGGSVPKKRHPQLNPDYRFEMYVIGESNSFAANAAMGIARNPGTAYNPYLIYGGPGLGKTHLMQAIGNYAYDNSGNKIIYTSAETFTNEFIDNMSDLKAKAAFKNKYRKADVLLIDDIHFLEGKKAAQEELFYTFDALFDEKKQLVFTCDRPISELKNFNDRLSSRIGRGLHVELQLPDLETRCAIFKKKSKIIGLNLSNDVIDFICRKIETNIRDLESALATLSAYASFQKTPLTIETAQEKLRHLIFNSYKQSNMSIEIIQRVAAEEFHLSINDLKSKKRTQSVVYPRQLAMYLIREMTEYTTTEIGEAFGGRDHTTVMHACQKIEERIKLEPSMESLVQSLMRSVKEYSTKS
jgi:chromosomal replication initiator protein